MQAAEKFGQKLRELRLRKNLTHEQLAKAMNVTRPTISRWESGTRVPDAEMLARLARCLGVDSGELLDIMTAETAAEPVRIMVVDDERIVLSGELKLLRQLLPEAEITGFSRTSEALAFAREQQISLALLDIELGRGSGLTLCRELMDLQPSVNVLFLTAYPGYSLQAWDTGASGFLVKPLNEDALRRQLRQLRHPIPGLEV